MVVMNLSLWNKLMRKCVAISVCLALSNEVVMRENEYRYIIILWMECIRKGGLSTVDILVVYTFYVSICFCFFWLFVWVTAFYPCVVDITASIVWTFLVLFLSLISSSNRGTTSSLTFCPTCRRVQNKKIPRRIFFGFNYVLLGFTSNLETECCEWRLSGREVLMTTKCPSLPAARSHIFDVRHEGHIFHLGDRCLEKIGSFTVLHSATSGSGFQVQGGRCKKNAAECLNVHNLFWFFLPPKSVRFSCGCGVCKVDLSDIITCVFV